VNRTVFSSYQKTLKEICNRTERTVNQFPDTQFSVVGVCVLLRDAHSRADVASVIDERLWGTGGIIFDTVEVLGEKTCPTACLPTTNPTCTGRGLNPCLRGQRPANNSLRHGTAMSSIVVCVLMFAENVSGTSNIIRIHLCDRGYPSREALVCVTRAAATFLSIVRIVRT
jgi:hypothetical protein